MAEAKVFYNGVWTPLCDIKYNKYVNGVWEPFYDRPITFYADDGTPYLFECTSQVDPVILSSTATITQTSIEINWSLLTDPQNPTPQGDTFDVYDANTNTIIAADVTGQTYEHTGLTTGVEYCYYVIAKATGYDNSDPSTTQCFTTASYSMPNDVVINDCNLRNSTAEGEDILVRFQTAAAADPEVDYYDLWYRLTGGSSYSLYGIPSINHNSDDVQEIFNVDALSLVAGEEYHFVVQAVGPGGSSVVSDLNACTTFYT